MTESLYPKHGNSGPAPEVTPDRPEAWGVRAHGMAHVVIAGCSCIACEWTRRYDPLARVVIP